MPSTTPGLFGVFTGNAAEVLGDTTLGLSGPEIVRVTSAYAVEFGVSIPHAAYPFGANVGNKRTALRENLMAFSDVQRYRIIRDLCDDHKLLARNPGPMEKLKQTLIARFGHLADEALGSEVDQELIERTRHWLAPFEDALKPYNEAAQKNAEGVYLRNVLDDLRLALELLVCAILSNNKSLENQLAAIGSFIQQRKGSPELANMFAKLLDYYTKYQNTYVKHDDAVIEDEVEFVFELTSVFMKHLVRLSYQIATA